MKKDLPLNFYGCRENNLKNFDLSLPANQLIAITGLSGSGKSSLAFHTIYAEGQQRYIETFSPYTRQFLDKLKKPDILYSEHMRPAIAIQQKTKIRTSRSTVGSMTDAKDLLKNIWPHLAKPFSRITGKELIRFSSADVFQRIKNIRATCADTIYIASPIDLGKVKLKRKSIFEDLLLRGYSRFYNPLKAERINAEKIEDLDLKSERLYLLLDRITKNINQKQIQDSIEQAYAVSYGTCIVLVENQNGKFEEQIFTEHYQLEDGERLAKTAASMFDYNSPVGACSDCKGFGQILKIDENKIIDDPSLSLEEGVVSCWNGDKAQGLKKKLLEFAKAQGIPSDQPWLKLSVKQRVAILEGQKGFKGAVPWLKSLESKSYKMHVRVFLSKYRSEVQCHTCLGTRLKPNSLLYQISGRTLPDIWNTPVADVCDWLKSVKLKNAEYFAKTQELNDTFEQLNARLESLCALGLPYLTLNRQSRTLSGGETQRVNLVTALGSELVSTTFVLDEPSVGLHPRDSDRLLTELQILTAKGNNVIVVEHDLDFIESADYIVELGPAAGETGGEITYQGNNKSWKGIKVSEHLLRDKLDADKFIKIKDVSVRNLQNFSCEIPIGNFTCICGVSGSGKSTLVEEVILKSKKNPELKVTGLEQFDHILIIDQSSLSKTPRANIATYSGIWERLRKYLSETPKALSRLLKPASFSFNVDGGRCPHCKGAGYIKEDMQFLSDAYVLCEHCLGQRFQDSVLDIEYLGKNVANWLDTTLNECADLLFDDKQINSAVQTLKDLGLGHLRLGHALSELSGGEAQRLKLVPFLEKSQQGRALLIFDEPTTGLHYYDTQRLLKVLEKLRKLEHTIICIEHNQEVILAADHIIDIGPEGGVNGGRLVYSGSVKNFLTAKSIKTSITARYLEQYISKYKGNQRSSKISKNKKIEQSRAEYLYIQGAKEHNLKNINLKLPHDQLIAFTGLSGSGKSSIAKDIIFAEGQRRYLDCLSPYARQFISELKKPRLDSITNVRPSICVEQNLTQVAKRSTLATVSEVYSFLRLLYSKAGIQFCPDHPSSAVEALTSIEIADKLKEYGSKTIRLIAPMINKKKGEHKEVFRRARQADIAEVRVNNIFGVVGKFDGELERHKTHSIDFVWGKFIPNRLPEKMLQDAIEEVFALSGGSIVVHVDNQDHVYSRERACPICNKGLFRPAPEDLSFNSTRGRCSHCEGLGFTEKEPECKHCSGSKLKALGRNIRISDLNIHQASVKTAQELRVWLKNIKFPAHLEPLCKPLVAEIDLRLQTLMDLGLLNLPLDRSCFQIASGELQRLRLAAALGSALTGAMYIFDEPSAGLHPNDNEHVLKKLRQLQLQGNSVILIEHDPISILSADHIVELGPGAGIHGGEIIFSGNAKAFKKINKKLLDFEISESEIAESKEFLQIRAGNINNLNNFELKIPLQRNVCIAGVSGAGKSSLVQGLIVKTIDIEKRGANNQWKSKFAELQSSISIDRLLIVDQSPIGRNSRSTPASYLNIWDEIRKLFAKTIEARTQGWNSGYFSYNGGKGACPNCKGLGEIKLDISFLNEARVECEVCRGQRYREETLHARYSGLSIKDVLDLNFEQAKSFFANHKKIHQTIHQACALGLGYLTLGQAAPTLSGGESQRLKLVLELAKIPREHTLYIFDEPSRGLHREDVKLLIEVFRRLRDQGHSVLVIEHDADIIRSTDYLIELGPKAGIEGGKVVYQGHPSQIKKSTAWGRLLSSQSVLKC